MPLHRGAWCRYAVPAQVDEAGGLKAFLFHRGFKQKLRYLDQGYAYDKVIDGISQQFCQTLLAEIVGSQSIQGKP